MRQLVRAYRKLEFIQLLEDAARKHGIVLDEFDESTGSGILLDAWSWYKPENEPDYQAVIINGDLRFVPNDVETIHHIVNLK